MAKFYGAIGFGTTEQVRPGVWQDAIVERFYYGDLVRNTSKLQSSEYLNDDITIANDISIISDPFADQNFHSIKYVEYLGTKWKVNSVDVQFPRLRLSVSGVYNA